METSGMACLPAFLIRGSGLTRTGDHGIRRFPLLVSHIMRIDLLEIPISQRGVTQAIGKLQEATTLKEVTVVMIAHPIVCPIVREDPNTPHLQTSRLEFPLRQQIDEERKGLPHDEIEWEVRP
jgi:hypothetical protein